MESLITALLLVLGACEPRVLDARTYHLGLAGQPEWLDPPSPVAESADLELKFHSGAPAGAATLLIRQREVKLRWPVLLNGQRLGHLEQNEIPLVTALEIPPGLLHEGENSLHILSPEEVDDISIEEIRLDPRPLAEVIGESTVSVQVRQKGSEEGLPCRLTIVDDRKCLTPLQVAPDERLAVRTGVIYTGSGSATFRLSAGHYTLYATRGPEYGLAVSSLALPAGVRREVALEIDREVATPGLISFDPHIHTFTHSHHGDATVSERMVTIAGEGLELAAASDHNIFVDHSAIARKLGLERYFTSLIADEVTTTTGHFTVFPATSTASPIPDFRLRTWPELFAAMRAVLGVRMVILNHPRDVHDGFTPFGPGNFDPQTGSNLRGSDFTFDGVEVLNSGTLQSDYRQNFEDWFALLNHGYRITAMGSSDSHDVSRSIVGQGRTYIAGNAQNPGRVDVSEACQNLLAGHATVSMGLLTRIRVEDQYGPGDLATITGPEIRVQVEVSAPSWIRADHLALYANGELIREQRLPAVEGIQNASVCWAVPRPPADIYLVAIATGPAVEEPYWKIPSPFQPTKGVRRPRVIGATNPVWIDADGDGKFTLRNR